MSWRRSSAGFLRIVRCCRARSRCGRAGWRCVRSWRGRWGWGWICWGFRIQIRCDCARDGADTECLPHLAPVSFVADVLRHCVARAARFAHDVVNNRADEMQEEDHEEPEDLFIGGHRAAETVNKHPDPEDAGDDA